MPEAGLRPKSWLVPGLPDRQAHSEKRLYKIRVWAMQRVVFLTMATSIGRFLPGEPTPYKAD